MKPLSLIKYKYLVFQALLSFTSQQVGSFLVALFHEFVKPLCFIGCPLFREDSFASTKQMTVMIAGWTDNKYTLGLEISLP